MKIIDFKTSAYFAGNMIFLGLGLTVIGVFVILSSLILGLVILFVCLLFFTTHYRLQIDLVNKTYHDYVWVLGTKHGTKGKFNQIEYLFVKKSKVSQSMHVRVAATTIRKEVYDGYLKFSESDKLHLLTKDNKEDLLVKLRAIAVNLNTKIVDHTLDPV